jgi:DNA ligase-1
MNTPCNVIKELEATTSRLEKESILAREADAENNELFEGLRLAYDCLISFGIKKIPSHSGPDGQGLPWPAFKQLADSLYRRELTGHDARDAINLALTVATQDEWNNFYKRILSKDLRAGISEVTINKVVKSKNKPQYSIPGFSCMLAHNGADHEKKIAGKKLLEPKLDGVRVLTVINTVNRTVTQYTRNGNVLENFSHITQAIEEHIDQFGRSCVLDGEMISTSFQALMKQVHRKKNVQTDDAVLMLFDIIPLTEFQQGKSKLGQRQRSNLLKSFKPVFDQIGNIGVIPQTEVDLDSYVGELQFKEFNKDAIDNGYEGIMIKDVDGVYECKRSVKWLKQKPYIEVSLAIVGFEAGTGRNEGRLGAFVCEGEDEGKRIRVNVGGGFSDEQREEFWKEKDTLLGQVVEVRADALTLNQDSDGVYSLRFSSFRRFRGFSAGEKI